MQINNEISDFLYNHILHNKSSGDIVNKILTEHPDCHFLGYLYRVLFIYKGNINNMNNDEILDFIKDNIKVSNKYNSTTKSFNSIGRLINYLNDDDNYIPVIISFSGNGLDINRLIEKAFYKKIINKELYDKLSEFKYQNEVVSIVPHDYKIIEIRK